MEIIARLSEGMADLVAHLIKGFAEFVARLGKGSLGFPSRLDSDPVPRVTFMNVAQRGPVRRRTGWSPERRPVRRRDPRHHHHQDDQEEKTLHCSPIPSWLVARLHF
jgi:hypothetical protein